ncbi:MAG: type II secretion system F family protein [Candidatus Eremiobacterota bacterium]
MSGARVAQVQVCLFTRQLACLLEAGVSLTRSLESLAASASDPTMREVVNDVHTLVSRGRYLSQAMQAHPGVFSAVYVAMVKVGESTGGLVVMLSRLAGWLERDHRLGQKVRSALTYPVFVLGLTALLVGILFATVLPGFVQLFRDSNVPTPWLTRVTFGAARILSSPGSWILLLTSLIGVAGWIKERRSTPAGRQELYRLALQVPVLNRLLRLGALTRFASAMSVMLGSGVALVTSLRMAGQAAGNPLLEKDAQVMAAGIHEGEELSDQMLALPASFPAAVGHLVAVGEQTGRLGEIFAKVGEYCYAEVNHLVDTLGALLEPFLLTMVAGVVAVTVLSIMLPLYGFIATLGL